MSKYRTSDNDVDLDIGAELNSYDSVGGVMERADVNYIDCIDKQYHDADFYIFLNDNSELEEIKNLLSTFCMSAYVELDDVTNKL